MSEFSLRRLMGTCLSPKEGERVVVLTDLKDPARGVTVSDILSGDTQRIAYEVFFQGLQTTTDFCLGAVSFYVFQEVQGSNLDLPSVVFGLDGREYSLVDVLRDADIVLALTSHSATGPLKILARELAFRAATSAGTNEAVLSSGLAADYREVSAVTKRLRDFLKGTKTVQVDYTVARRALHFTIQVSDQDLGIDDGIYTKVGEIGNLPTGEVFYVPERVDGVIPSTLRING